MRHFISLAVLLVVFFWVGQGSVQHVFASSDAVVAANEIRKMSKDESQAKALAERRFNNFMKVYNKIWSLFGSIHDDFTGTPGDPRFARLSSYWRSYETNKRHGYKMERDIIKFYDSEPKTPGGPYAEPRMTKLNVAANKLNPKVGFNHIALLGLDSFKQKAQQIATNAEAAKQAMEQACADRDRTKANSMAQQSKEAATSAVKNYKIMRERWPYIKEQRDEYRDFREDLLFMEKFAKEFHATVQKVEKAEAALLKELGDSRGVFRYFKSKHSRFNDLQQTLNTPYMEFKVFAVPYKDNAWAKNSLSNVQEALKRVNAISTSIPDYLPMSDLWYEINRASDSGRYDHFIGVNKNLGTFFSTVDEIQKVGQKAKGEAEAALNNAKKAKACADKLPILPPKSNKDHACPSNWKRCGSHCCPPDVPCWDYGAIQQAVEAGRCR
jgi:hypothetical protein